MNSSGGRAGSRHRPGLKSKMQDENLNPRVTKNKRRAGIQLVTGETEKT
jgi:hypothetical protein